jgi:hypothetical protein
MVLATLDAAVSSCEPDEKVRYPPEPSQVTGDHSFNLLRMMIRAGHSTDLFSRHRPIMMKIVSSYP